jgi:hypothetical protein
MRDKFYGDNRDLVKWGVLLELSDQFNCKQILQVLYYRPESIVIDGRLLRLRSEVVAHFRDVTSIAMLKSRVEIKLLKDEFRDREAYLESIKASIRALGEGPAIVFLDPDTGIEPESGNYDETHVLAVEAIEIWKSLRLGDVLVLYQHQDNRAGREWVQRKRVQFANALRIEGPQSRHVKLANAPDIAKDVAFYFVRKN